MRVALLASAAAIVLATAPMAYAQYEQSQPQDEQQAAAGKSSNTTARQLEQERQELAQAADTLDSKSSDKQAQKNADEALNKIGKTLAKAKQGQVDQQTAQAIEKTERDVTQAKQTLNQDPGQAASQLRQIDEQLQQIQTGMQHGDASFDRGAIHMVADQKQSELPSQSPQTAQSREGAADNAVQQPRNPAQSAQAAGQDQSQKKKDVSNLKEIPQGMKAEDIKGKEVLGRNGNTLGKVGNIRISQDGKVQSVVIDRGGFLGIGQAHVAIDWDRLKMSQNGDLVADLSESELAQLPNVEK